jgi:hypothetical protein
MRKALPYYIGVLILLAAGTYVVLAVAPLLHGPAAAAQVKHMGIGLIVLPGMALAFGMYDPSSNDDNSRSDAG